MECEMCGKVVPTRRYLVEGTAMNLGLECSKYGTPLDAPAPAGSPAAMQQGLERRAQRMTSRSVYEGEALVLVEDFGRVIQRSREAKSWSLEQLGNKVSARVPELKHIEAGKLRPGDDLARRLEKELGITLMEKVEAAIPGASKKAGAGLTIADILKDAKRKP
ncbi:MAG: multiprotein bridging factor aMBF1 [Thermoplasmatota archaeon]